MTTKKKMAMLDRLVKVTEGKGRAQIKNKAGKGPIAAVTCAYFPGGGHPGCGIGCQLGFRAKFSKIIPDGENLAIRAVLIQFPTVGKFFGVKSPGDIDYLEGLQNLHDDVNNWERKSLKKDAVKDFVTRWELN